MKEEHVPKRKPRRIRCANCPYYDAHKLGFGYQLVHGEVLVQQEKGVCRGKLPETHRVGQLAVPMHGAVWFLLQSGWDHVDREDWCRLHPDFEERRKS